MTEQCRCPNCDIPLRLRARARGRSVSVSVMDSTDMEADIIRLLARYWRWCAEGKLKYAIDKSYDPAYQCYYERGIEREDEGVYSFFVQSSLDRKEYYRGTLKMVGHKIEIIEVKKTWMS